MSPFPTLGPAIVLAFVFTASAAAADLKSPADFGEDDFRRFNPRFQGENFQKNLELVEKVKTLGERRGVTASQMALAWVLAQGDDIVPIPGTKRRKYLEENAAAVDIELTPEELEAIQAIFPPGAASGPRYGEAMMKAVNR